MKYISLLVAALLLCLNSSGQKNQSGSTQSHRVEKIINSDWIFNYFPESVMNKGYEASRFDDSRWPVVCIPHCWNTFETTGELHPFIRNISETENPYWWSGWAWYRKHFSINKDYSALKVFIEFEGVQKYCKVWINGKYLGDHHGGYGSFDFDISSFLNYGEDNVIAVAVNNRQNDDLKTPPMAGEFNVYGGIHRNVKLVLTDKLYIPMQGSSSHEGGTYITTPGLSPKEGKVRVQTWVKNDYPASKTCTLLTSVTDTSGNIIQTVKSEATIEAGQTFTFDQTTKPVKNPHLWSPDDPYLYNISVRVMDGKINTDVYSGTFGFRWFKWDYSENVLVLNGEKAIIHGGNRQAEYPWLGSAIPEWITLMDFTDIAKNLNYNFIRTSHFPNEKHVYDLTDRFGLITVEEAPNCGNSDFSPAIQAEQLKEMIRRDRNHPSILFWSLGSETDHIPDPKTALSEDSTRILTSDRTSPGASMPGTRHSERNLSFESNSISAVRGWYNKDVKDPEPTDGNQSGTEERQQALLKASEKFGKGNFASWIYADYGSRHEALNSPLLHVTPQGYTDPYRFPKYAYYFWQANYAKTPMVFIQPHNWRSQYLGQLKDFVVSSNCGKVELFVNGQSRGYKLPDEANYHSVTFNNVPVEAGTLTVVGTSGGKTVKSELMLAGRPAKIILRGSHPTIKADRSSILLITADITDSWGNHVYGANNSLKWSVTGPATLVGPENYDSDINRNHSLEGTWYIDVPVANVLRSNGKAGKIHVTVSATGLTAGSFDIEADAPVIDYSIISEPALNSDGRIAVARMKTNGERPEVIPVEINTIGEDLSFGTMDKNIYTDSLKTYIKRNNSAVDTTSVEIKTLLDILSVQLSNSDGRINSEDFNFSVTHFNKSRLIARYINSTKLPLPFKDGLRKYYSEAIIRMGAEKDAGDEMNWLNWIPSGGTVVIVQDEKPAKVSKDLVFTSSTNLEKIICAVYPQFEKFSKEAKERALIFTSKANPYVHLVPALEQAQKDKQVSDASSVYSAEKGKPILVPLLKFIAE